MGLPVTRRLVLGSSSTYRRALLGRLGLPFDVRSPDVDESEAPGETPQQTAERLAAAKARAVARLETDCVVIGSDQVAASGDLRLGKPGDPVRAVRQLLEMRGRTLCFYTALHVVEGGSGRTLGTHCDETRVVVRGDLDTTMLERYVALDHPLDCAGSAKVESLGIALLERCESEDPTALIGLPMIALARILRGCGIDPLRDPPGVFSSMNKPSPALDHPAPAFSLAGTLDADFSLQARAGHWLVLYFYPKDDTPGCTTESAAFRDAHSAFAAAGCDIAGVSRDSLASHRRFSEKLGLPFDLLSDADETLCTLYGVMRLKNMYGKQVRGIERSTFLIDPDGVLRHEWRGVKVAGHVDEVLATLHRLQAG